MESHPFKPLAWTAFCGIITLTILLAITVAQTTEPLTTSPPSEAKKAGTIDKDSANTLNTALPDSTAIAVEMQRHFNELRRELLDDRARVVDWWLFATGIVLTFFGIVVAIVGIVGFRRFREIESEARNSIETVTELKKAAKHHLEEIERIREKSDEIVRSMNAQIVADDPDGARQAVDNIQNNPDATLIDKAIAHAVFLQRQGKTDDAIEKWRAVAHIAEETDNDLAARAWFSVGYLIGNEDLESSISAYDHAIRLKPLFAEAFYNMGNANSALGRQDEAIADYGNAINLRPNFVEAYINRGSVKRKLKRHEEAIVDYDEAIRLKPDLAEGYYNLGVSKRALGRNEEAILDYSEAIRLNPDFAAAYYNSGIARGAMKQYDKAVADFNQAIRLRPDDARAQYNRGIANGALERYEEAIKDYDEAIRISPDFAAAYINRGSAKSTLKRYEEAIADFNEAVRLRPDSAQSYYNRGISNQMLHRHHKAVADYDEAVRLKPDYGEAYGNRGVSKAALGLKSDARTDLETALEVARNAGNENLAAQAEKSLRDLDLSAEAS